MLQIIAFGLAATLAAGVAAQQAAQSGPADPKAAVPVQRYESAFRDYRPHAAPELARWRDANDEAGRIGGHAGYARQSAPQRKSAPKPPQQAGHGAHK